MEWWSIEVFHGRFSAARWKDAAPDPVKGLLVHRGRGGAAGTRLPRRPRPLAGAGAVELPEPDPDPIEEEDFEPYWIESGFHDDMPEPVPDPSPLHEPAAASRSTPGGLPTRPPSGSRPRTARAVRAPSVP